MKVARLCLTLCDPIDYTNHGIFQSRILEWVAFPFSRGSSQPRDRTRVSCIAGGFFTSWDTRQAFNVRITPLISIRSFELNFLIRPETVSVSLISTPFSSHHENAIKFTVMDSLVWETMDYASWCFSMSPLNLYFKINIFHKIFSVF